MKSPEKGNHTLQVLLFDGINKVKTKQNNLVDSRKGVYHLRKKNTTLRINCNDQEFYL